MAGTHDTILTFDTETTGLSVAEDQIIELCVQSGFGNEAKRRTWRFKPDVPISPVAQQVHGIGLDDLEGCPRFADKAPELRRIFGSAVVLSGYNVRFDLDILQTEFVRAGVEPLDLSQTAVIDAYRLWQQMERRGLEEAHKRFVGGSFMSTHSAESDTAATARVLAGMIDEFGLGDLSWSELAELCDPERETWVGPSHHLRWHESKVVVGFGRHRGASLAELAQGPNAGYLAWVISADFPEHVKRVCDKARSLDESSLHQWVAEAINGPPE